MTHEELNLILQEVEKKRTVVQVDFYLCSKNIFEVGEILENLPKRLHINVHLDLRYYDIYDDIHLLFTRVYNLPNDIKVHIHLGLNLQSENHTMQEFFKFKTEILKHVITNECIQAFHIYPREEKLQGYFWLEMIRQLLNGRG